MTTDNPVHSAETEIAMILARLETETGMIVDGIRIDEIDASTFAGRRFMRRVDVTMKDRRNAIWSQIDG